MSTTRSASSQVSSTASRSIRAVASSKASSDDIPETLKLMLSTFKCNRNCHIHDRINYMFEVPNCPFSHRYSDNYEKMREMPSFVCVKYLLGKCNNSVNRMNTFCQCSDGFHLKEEELGDLEGFGKKMNASLMELEQYTAKVMQAISSEPSSRRGVKRSAPESPDPECTICLNPITSNFGFLQNCSHVTCSGCILAWFNQADSKRTCPVCRQESEYVLIWPVMITSLKEKKEIITQQLKGFQLESEEEDPKDDTQERRELLVQVILNEPAARRQVSASSPLARSQVPSTPTPTATPAPAPRPLRPSDFDLFNMVLYDELLENEDFEDIIDRMAIERHQNSIEQVPATRNQPNFDGVDEIDADDFFDDDFEDLLA